MYQFMMALLLFIYTTAKQTIILFAFDLKRNVLIRNRFPLSSVGYKYSRVKLITMACNSLSGKRHIDLHRIYIIVSMNNLFILVNTWFPMQLRINCTSKI